MPRLELEQFSKRLKKAVEGPEPVYFDPATVSFIPESRLELFILEERRKTENHGELYSTPYPSFCSVGNVFENFSSVNMAEEAGLIMPQPPHEDSRLELSGHLPRLDNSSPWGLNKRGKT